MDNDPNEMEQPVTCSWCNDWMELEDGCPIWEEGKESTNVLVCPGCYDDSDQCKKEEADFESRTKAFFIQPIDEESTGQ